MELKYEKRKGKCELDCVFFLAGVLHDDTSGKFSEQLRGLKRFFVISLRSKCRNSSENKIMERREWIIGFYFETMREIEEQWTNPASINGLCNLCIFMETSR